MNEQLSIFDIINKPDAPEPDKKDELKDWALVYLVKKASGNAGNLWVMRVEDAQKLCSDDCSHGQALGGYWMFQWTTIDHFVRQNDQYDKRLEDFVFIWDSGKQDKDFDRLGIRKPTLKEQTEVLHRLGYVMTWK